MLVGCTGAVQMFPTVTSTPTRTLITRNVATRTPTSTVDTGLLDAPTITPSPNIVPSPTPLSTAKIPLRLGDYIMFSEEGFAFRPIVGFNLRNNGSQITLESDDGEILITFFGSNPPRVGDLDMILTRFLDIFSNVLEDFEYDGFEPYTIDGNTGLATEISGIYQNTRVRGQVVIVSPSDRQLFYAIALSEDDPLKDGWETDGRQAFETVSETIYFFTPQPTSSGQ